MKRDKKRAAAVSAVLAYIQKEAEQRVPSVGISLPVTTAYNVWGISGRQSQMQLRNMMQLKGFHGARLR